MRSRVHLKALALAALAGAVAWSAAAVGPPPAAAETASEPHKKRQLAWWESARASKPDAASQLAFADALRDQGRLIQASKQYRALTYAWPQAPEASQAQYRFAQLLERRGKDKDAFEEYQYLLEAYAGFVPYAEVLERQYGIADRLATASRHFLFVRYQSPEEAIPLFETLIQNGPQWKRAQELQFRIARIHETREEFDLAMDAYALYQQKYPLSPLTEQAAYGHGRCAYRYAQAHPNATDLRQTAEAILLSFLERYPRSEMAAAARSQLNELQEIQAAALFRQAAIYERQARDGWFIRGKPAARKAAQLAYQRVIDEYPLSARAQEARQHLNRINPPTEPDHEHP